MKKSTVGALLLLVLGAAAVIGWTKLRPRFFEWSQRQTSDAAGAAETLRIGGDHYVGHWFISAPEMRKQAARDGIGIQYTSDGGAHGERMAKFAAGEYDAIVLPVASYLQHGGATQFPGVIVAAIAESRGADAIVGFESRFPSGKIDSLDNADLEIVYASGSTSEFLLDLTIADVDLDALASDGRWRGEVDSSKSVYQRARDGEGDAFALGEPDLSRALSLPNMTYVWGSDKLTGYMIDVLVVRRDVLKEREAAIRSFLDTYFRVLTFYANNRDRLVQEIRRSADLDAETVRTILGKVEWFDLEENRAQQFGIAQRPGESVNDGLINTIISCTDVLVRSGRLDGDPLGGNPYLITNSSVLEELVAADRSRSTDGASVTGFEALSAEGWAHLKPVGTFRVEPVPFQTWNSELTDDGKAAVDKIAQQLEHHDTEYRLLVTGHTEPGGDEVENVKLSLARARAITQYLEVVHGLDADRLRAQGVGSQQPPRRKPGESPRAYRYRLSRVEFTALEANPL